MTWIIVLILIGGTIAIMVKRSRKKTVTPLKKEEPTVLVQKSEPVKKSETPKVQPKTKKERSGGYKEMIGWVIAITLLALVIWKILAPAYVGTRNYIKETYKEADVTLGTKKQSTSVQIVNSITEIQLGTEYGATYILPSGHGFRFSANTDYCVKDANGTPFCAKAGQDASWQMPGGHQNMKLRFMSSSGKHGTLKIEIWPK